MSGEQSGNSNETDTDGASSGRFDELGDIPSGTVLGSGIAAFAAGYLGLFTLLTILGNIRFSDRIVSILRSVGHAFYNAFNVPTFTESTRSIRQGGAVTSELVEKTWLNSVTGFSRVKRELYQGGELVNETAATGVTGSGPSIPAIVYLLVPVVVLVGVATLVGYRALPAGGSKRERAIRWAMAGAIYSLGFLLVALVGTYILTQEQTQTFLRPARLETLIYGIAYPAVFGTGGIVLGQRLQTRWTDRPSDE